MLPPSPDRTRPAAIPSGRAGQRRSRRHGRADGAPSRPPRWCGPPGTRRLLRNSVCAWTKRAMLRAGRLRWQPRSAARRAAPRALRAGRLRLLRRRRGLRGRLGVRLLLGRLRLGLIVLRLLRGRFFLAGDVALRFLVALEVRPVPAGALQAEDRRGHEPLERWAAAGRALAQWPVADLLELLVVVAAGGALVFVKRHRRFPSPAIFA